MMRLDRDDGHQPMDSHQLGLLLPYFEGSRRLKMGGAEVELAEDAAVVFRGAFSNPGEPMLLNVQFFVTS